MKTRLAIILAAAATAANAGVVTVDYTGTGRGQQVKIIQGSDSRNVFAGQLEHTISNGVGADAHLNGMWLTYCSELSQSVASNAAPYFTAPVSALPSSAPMGAAKAAAIFDIYRFAQSAPHTNSTSNDYATAFQLAIWEIVNDFNSSVGASSLSLTAGNFRATRTNGSALSSGITTIVQSLFNSIGQPSNATFSIVGLTNSTKQDQIVPVPAPGAAGLAACGLMLAGRRRRK